MPIKLSRSLLVGAGIIASVCIVMVCLAFLSGAIIPTPTSTPSPAIVDVSTIIFQTAMMASTQTALVIPITMPTLTSIPTETVAPTLTFTSTETITSTATATIFVFIAPTFAASCLAAYPDFCITDNPRLSCDQLSKNFTVLSPDPLGYDRDNDGIGCEG